MKIKPRNSSFSINVMRINVLEKILLLLTAICLSQSLSGQIFTDVTQQAGINVQAAMGDVIVWIDYNNDSYPDFFGSSQLETFFYKNNADNTFTDITSQSGLSAVSPRGLAVGDYDNDGFSDLLISSLDMGTAIKIYRNNSGNGFYESWTFGYHADRGIWLDYNVDGLIDVFFNTGTAVYLYRNNGDGTFTDISWLQGFAFNSGITSAAADYDNNGLPDIYCTVHNTNYTNRLYRNEAGGHYADVTYAAGVTDFRNGAAQAWGDYDNDGYLDLYIGNISSNRNVLFHNDQDGTFTDVTLAAGVPDAGDARTCSWVDVNHDGLLDLFTTNHVNTNKLYKNNGNGTFTDIGISANIQDPSDGFAVSWGDYDRDGDQDVLFAGHSYAMRLLRNDGGNALNYLNIKLVGTYDNRSAIGTRLTFYYNNLFQIREVNGGRGAVEQDDLCVHLGLGAASLVDSILIQWPDGMLQKEYSVNANQFITITQAGDVPPSMFHLLSPLPSLVNTGNQIMFRWSASSDPDSGNNIHYTLYIESPGHDTVIGPLADTFALVSAQPWMDNDSVYWYVRADDGAQIRFSWERWPLNYVFTTGLKPENVNTQDFSVVSLSPVPAGEEILLQADVRVPGLFHATFADVSGAVVKNYSPMYLVKGRQQIKYPTSELKRGLLILNINFKGEKQVFKVIVQ
jgi:hypothetical protein